MAQQQETQVNTTILLDLSIHGSTTGDPGKILQMLIDLTIHGSTAGDPGKILQYY